jgi:hypothetical protein
MISYLLAPCDDSLLTRVFVEPFAILKRPIFNSKAGAYRCGQFGSGIRSVTSMRTLERKKERRKKKKGRKSITIRVTQSDRKYTS